MRVFINLIFVVTLIGCVIVEQPKEPFSFDKKYKVETSIDGEGIIILTIYKDEQKIKTLNTRASIGHKYAVGWLKNENILILNSSDIGVVVWSEADNFALHKQPGKYESYGRQLFNSKYKST